MVSLQRLCTYFSNLVYLYSHFLIPAWKCVACLKILKCLRVLSNCFHEYYKGFSVFFWPPQSPALNLLKHICDEVKWEIYSLKVQLTNCRKYIMQSWCQHPDFKAICTTPCGIHAMKQKQLHQGTGLSSSPKTQFTWKFKPRRNLPKNLEHQ